MTQISGVSLKRFLGKFELMVFFVFFALCFFSPLCNFHHNKQRLWKIIPQYLELHSNLRCLCSKNTATATLKFLASPKGLEAARIREQESLESDSSNNCHSTLSSWAAKRRPLKEKESRKKEKNTERGGILPRTPIFNLLSYYVLSLFWW